jgi:hypothetical protein
LISGTTWLAAHAWLLIVPGDGTVLPYSYSTRVMGVIFLLLYRSE